MPEPSAALFDSHAHLDFADFDGDLDGVLQRARAAGVAGVIAVGSGRGLESRTAAVALAGRHPDVWATVGIHPHDASLADDAAVAALRELAAQPRVVALGELGLDFHYDHSPRPRQREAFAAQLRVARELGLPVVVHTREADEDTLAILRAEGVPHGGVLHCFSGGEPLARAGLELGLHVSFSGILTFPKADALRAVARDVVPLDRTLVETDSPYLAPVPHRGRRCEPAHVVHTARRLAELHGLTLEDVARITTRNARRLFRLESGRAARLAYPIRDSLYLNLTNRCTLACTFCPKRGAEWSVKGHDLKLDREPSAAEVRAAAETELARRTYRELVFCGFGESTLRLDVLRELAPGFRARGLHVRLDTDGLANLVHGRDVAAELAGVVDEVSVSLNAADAATHARLCPSRYGELAWPAVLEFLRSAKRHLGAVTATVVAVPGLDLEACRRLAEDQLGVRFRVRPYNVVG
jgi:TatD DNase family protein